MARMETWVVEDAAVAVGLDAARVARRRRVARKAIAEQREAHGGCFQLEPCFQLVVTVCKVETGTGTRAT